MTTEDITIINEENIKGMVYEVRGQRVMLDFDLARIYGFETGAFNRQVKRNIERFPDGFRFRLTRGKSQMLLRCQNGILEPTNGRPTISGISSMASPSKAIA